VTSCFSLPVFGEGQGGAFLARRCIVEKDLTPALPEAGEFSGTRFPEMEVRSWRVRGAKLVAISHWRSGVG
jgi:hypothetical protein